MIRDARGARRLNTEIHLWSWWSMCVDTRCK